jgi:hypothetical protein
MDIGFAVLVVGFFFLLEFVELKSSKVNILFFYNNFKHVRSKQSNQWI